MKSTDPITNFCHLDFMQDAISWKKTVWIIKMVKPLQSIPDISARKTEKKAAHMTICTSENALSKAEKIYTAMSSITTTSKMSGREESIST